MWPDDIILVGKYVYGCQHQYSKQVEWWGLVGVVGANRVMGVVGDLVVVGLRVVGQVNTFTENILVSQRNIVVNCKFVRCQKVKQLDYGGDS